jgi:hypothetical protein
MLAIYKVPYNTTNGGGCAPVLAVYTISSHTAVRAVHAKLHAAGMLLYTSRPAVT